MQFSLLTMAFLAAFTSTIVAQDIEQEVAAFTQKWQTAYDRADIATLSTMYANEVTSLNSDGSTTTLSKAQIEAGLKNDFTTFNTESTIKLNRMIAQVGGKVKVYGQYSINRIAKSNGEKSNVSGKFEHFVVREGSQWKLCQLNMMPDK